MKINIYNTLTKKLEVFKPYSDNKVGMYVCGPTVYDYDHLGHARVGIFYDIVRRYLKRQNYSVKFVQNITDVGHLTDDADEGEDKIEKKAQQEKTDPKKIAKRFERAHFEDMKSLGILPPDESPRASEFIDKIIKFVRVLLKKGFAYESQGSVYFDVTKLTSYGKLSGRDFADQLTGTRTVLEKGKKHPVDFALWIKAKPSHILKWSSPWGLGYPGWHIECSVMNKNTLGPVTDIHGGAIELVFPHHENEIAQSQAFNGHNPVRYWLHIGMVSLDGRKMSKSKGNFIKIQDALKKYSSDEIRLAFCLSNYRKPFDYTAQIMQEAQGIVEKLIRQKQLAKSGKGIVQKLDPYLANDFNTPKVINEIIKNMSKLTKSDFLWIKEVLGLKLKKIQIKLTKIQQFLIYERETARKRKNWHRADQIRQKLLKYGIKIEDTPSGPKTSATY